MFILFEVSYVSAEKNRFLLSCGTQEAGSGMNFVSISYIDSFIGVDSLQGAFFLHHIHYLFFNLLKFVKTYHKMNQLFRNYT